MFGANMYGGTHFGENYFGDGTGAAAVVNPFGDVRYLGFGARVRRTAALWVVFLCLLVG